MARIPDMVAFNARVHEKLDPWREKRWFRWGAYAALAGFFMVMAAMFLAAANTMSREEILAYRPSLPTMVRGHDGELVGSYARQRRVELAYEDYPDQVVQAFISAEDKTFFSHGGIDYPGLVAAIGEFTVKTVTGGGRSRGSSTITQQVAKNLSGDDDYSVLRKIREAVLAFRIEDTLTKQEILALYLNEIFLGRNAYGVQAAARAYFDKDVDELDLHEVAYLAAIPKGPANYHPVRNKERATARRNYVLTQMAANDFISEAQRDRAMGIELAAIPTGSAKAFEERGGYFLEEVRRALLEDYGEDAADGENSIYAGGLWVRTSMDPVMQDAAAEALREALARFDGPKGWRDLGMTVDMDQDWESQLRIANVGTGFGDWRKAVVLEKDGGAATIGFVGGQTASLPRSAATMPVRGGGGIAFDQFRPGMIIVVKDEGDGSFALRSIPEVGGAFVAQEVDTGRVLAMQGGFDVLGSSFNRATQANRQPGSAFKPVVYLTALENGYTPASTVVDAPFCVWQGAALGEKCFRNFDGKYAGPKTLRWGVEQSRNLMTVRVASDTGINKVMANAEKLGLGEYEPYLSMALGAGETTPLKLVNAYAILANHGREVRPSLIDYVQDRAGKVIFRADNRCAAMENCNAGDWDGSAMPRPPKRGRQLVDPMAAYQMVHVMEGVVTRGTAQRLAQLDRPLFGKTGTTSGPTNVWFVGGTPDVVTGTYIGYDDNRDMGGNWVQGGSVAGPVFLQFAEKALADAPKTPFVAPEGISFVRIDRRTGERVYGAFPREEERLSTVIWEAFQPKTEPRRSFRNREEEEEAPQVATRPAVVRQAPRPQTQPDESDFLQREGGIY
ncbi:penicillin-binding protein 1A [Sphingomicrobium aestuariivivum]|uniref:penicillin-binding protein 1A n=1 Tax=Sphingomicrobium aestuariivivum TaxID=1582356 RepID=UPI001FD68FAF|nr:PBP1A family penicillin-binding protein [Sphingomicrobium aestuariivivum]MCJ8190514.1 PBP1A family penicillin-binding protein [Sphingomicrobium aestuariivivum]